MGGYRFYRLDRQGQAEGPGEDFECPDDSQAHGRGWEMIMDDPLLPGVEIREGGRTVARLTRYLKPES